MSAEHERRACDLPAGELQRAFDKESTTSNVAAHVTSCEPCSGSLNVLQTQRDAVRYLTTEQTAAARRTAVEFVLAQSATAGRQKLADLLYELAKAFVLLVPQIRRRCTVWSQPREIEIVSVELIAMHQRLDDGCDIPNISGAKGDTQRADRAASAGASCLTSLYGIEGRSVRYSGCYAQLHIANGRPDAAEVLLRQLLADEPDAVGTAMANRNIVLCLIQQRKFSDAVAFAHSALETDPNDAHLLYNYAVALAWERREAEFRRVGSRLAQRFQRGELEWLRSAVLDQASRLAVPLGTSADRIMATFGVAASDSDPI